MLARQQLRLWLQTLKAVRSVKARLRSKLRADHDTTLPCFDLLTALHRERQIINISALSKHLVVSNGHGTGVINQLVAEGLVAQETLASDRRAFLVRITKLWQRQKAQAPVPKTADAQMLNGSSRMHTAFGSVYALIASEPNSRPKPDIFIPPKGIAVSSTLWVLIQTVPASI